MFTHGGEEFRLLDRVYAQVGFQVEVQVEHFRRVTGLLADGRQEIGFDLLRTGGRRWRDFVGQIVSWFYSRRSLHRCEGGNGSGWDGMRLPGERGPGNRSAAVLPAGFRRGTGGRALVTDAQGSLDDFQFRGGVTGHIRQPALVGRFVHAFTLAGDAAQECDGNLRAKAGAEAQGILHGVLAAARKVQVAEGRVRLEAVFDVSDGRNKAVFERLDRRHILDADAHGVAGIAFRVGDHHLVGVFTKDTAQGMDLCRRASAARRGVGLMGDEDGLGRDLAAGNAKALLGSLEQGFHHLTDMLHVEPRAMEGAVGRDRGQHLADGAHAALAHGVFGFDDQRSRAHTDNHAVAAAVEGQGRQAQFAFGGGRAAGHQGGADPLRQAAAGDVIPGNDDHAAGAPGADPILGDGDGVGGGGAGSVDMGVRAARPDVFGELGMSHRQDAEDVAPVEVVVEAANLGLQFGNAFLESLFQVGLLRRHQGRHAAQFLELAAQGPVLVEAGGILGHPVEAGESRGEDHAGLIGQRFGQFPAVRQEGAGGSSFVSHHERDAGVAQGFNAGGNGQLGGNVNRLETVLGDAKLLHRVELAALAGQFEGQVEVVNLLHDRPGLALHQPDGTLFEHGASRLLRQRLDAHFTPQQGEDVAVIEHAAAAAGKSQPGTADDHRAGQRQTAICNDFRRCNRLSGRNLRGRGGRGPRACRGRSRSRNAGGVEAAQCLMETQRPALARMIGGQHVDIAFALEDIHSQGAQDALWANLDEEARSLGVEPFDAAHVLYRRGHLIRQEVQDFLAPGRVQVAGHVGGDGQFRRLDVHLLDDLAQRPAGRGDDTGVESVRNRNLGGLKTGSQESLDSGFHGGRLAANDALHRAVQIGNHHVAGDGRQDGVHLPQRRGDGGHTAGIGQRDARHLLAACADDLQRLRQVQDARRHQGGVFAQTVPDDEIGTEAVFLHQPQQRHVDGQDGRLGDDGVAQFQLRLFERFPVAVGEDVTGQRTAQDRRHGRVGLAEGFGHQRFQIAQVAQHVDVLRTLAGEEEGHFAGPAAAAVDALQAKRLPGRVRVCFQRLEGFGGASQQFRAVLEINHQAFGLADFF